MKEIEFDYILQWWLREPQPPGKTALAPFRLLRVPQPPKSPRMRTTATETTENESLRHRERQVGHRFVFVASRTSATKDESLSHRFVWLREPQPPKPPGTRAYT